MSAEDRRKLALSEHVYGDFIPHMPREPSADYWLLDDQLFPDDGHAAGLFLRTTPTEEDLIDMQNDAASLEGPMSRMSVAAERRTLFLAPVPSPLGEEAIVVDEPPRQVMGVVEYTGKDKDNDEGGGLFLRSELDDWVLA